MWAALALKGKLEMTKAELIEAMKDFPDGMLNIPLGLQLINARIYHLKIMVEKLTKEGSNMFSSGAASSNAQEIHFLISLKDALQVK